MKKIVLLIAILVAFTMCLSTVKAATEEEIEQAIVDGLAWLAAQQNANGSWGDWYQVAHTALAVKKFEHRALDLDPPMLPLDPAYQYYPQVKNGLDYLFSRACIMQITPQNAGDPDSDGDGIGVYFNYVDCGGFDHDIYETGAALMAIVENNCPDSVVNVPDSPVNGWTYYDVAVDAMDYLAFAQTDLGFGRGGWDYSYHDNSGDRSDNSITGYATLGLAYASAPPPFGFGIPVLQFVKDELEIWTDYIQCGQAGPDFGGSGYSFPCDWVNTLKTGNLLFEFSLLVQNLPDADVQRAIDYLILHWNDPNDDPGWQNHCQAMYCIMKGLEFQGIGQYLDPPANTIDWYDELTDQIVANQLADGSWPADLYGDMILTTAWCLLTLEKAAPPVPEIKVNLDIKPQSCPNPFNTKAKGVLPVAILGTEDFDVSIVDPATVLLEGVSPLRWDYEDVSRPVDPREDVCDCTADTGDGYMDMTLKFDRQEILAALEPVSDGEVRVLTLTGLTYDGIDIKGHDCVVIIHKLKGGSLEGSKGFCEGSYLSKLSGAGLSAEPKSDIAHFMTVFNTDFVVAGFGGMRNTGFGDITLAGVTGPVTEAYLYWNGPTNSLDPSANANVFVNGTPVTGTNIGFSDDNCWGYDNSQSYRADVTALVQATGNGTYALRGFGAGPDINSNGASLIVFFDDGDPTNNRDAVVFDGNDSNIDNPYDAPGWNVTLSGIDYDSGSANMQLHVADGQEYLDDALILNGLTLDPGPEIFQGNSVPSDNNGPIDNGNLWDIRTYDVTSFLTPGENTLSLTTGVLDDCLGLIVAIVDLPAGAAPEQPVVMLDIKPQSCPNPFNTKAKGVLPVAILGTEDFDVSIVDPATVLLEGVSPLRWDYEDVSTPVEPGDDTCECTTEGADGYMDMTLKFDRQEILAALEPVSDGEVRVLTLTGMTYDGTYKEGQDCVVILMKIKATPFTDIPSAVSLGSNSPNPFNPETDISFSLPERTQVSLFIYNILGEKVKTLVSGDMAAGTYTIHWNGRDEAGNSVASGIYFYRLKTQSFDQTKKMVLMK